MQNLALGRMSLLRVAALGSTALAMMVAPFTIGDVAAGVGVTSATDGDPLGKPPQESERVLRIGIDVQANERITTNSSDRAHLVFLDGSSLTVGPSAQLIIDKFVFDPATKTGELSISATKGVLRVVGGKISKNSPITITTPSNSIGIRGGITVVDVSSVKTDAIFVFGKGMTVTGGGQTQTASRPGSIISTSLGGAPGMPTLLSQGGLTAQLRLLEGRPASEKGSGGGSSGGRNPDQVAQSSGFSGTNSGQSVRIVAPGLSDNGAGPRNRNPNDTVVTALSNANQATQSQTAVQTLSQVAAQVPALVPDLPPPPTTGPIITQEQFNARPDVIAATGVPSGGTTTPVSDVNMMTSTATYVGTMAGLINNKSTAFGSYQNTWNFASRSGVASINFDSAQFQANTTQNGNSAQFSTHGPVPSTNTNRSLVLNGGFVSTPGNPAGFQAGNFNINGKGGYEANGGFLATKQP